MKFDISNDTQKHLLWKQYVAWHCNGYTAAPISDYISNPVFQELLLESDYFARQFRIEKLSRNDSKLHLTIELKNPLAKKWGLEFGDIKTVNNI